jgi:hypothetical protein
VRAVEAARTARLAGQAGQSRINRIVKAVRALKLARTIAEVIESATKALGYAHGPPPTLEDGTFAVTSARTGPTNSSSAFIPDESITRGTATIEMGPHLPGGVKVTNVKWD